MTVHYDQVVVKCSKTHFFEALIADQMHDFLLHTDERASSMTTVFEMLRKLDAKKTSVVTSDVEMLVRIWQSQLDKSNKGLFMRITNLCSNNENRLATASQHVAELVVSSPVTGPRTTRPDPASQDAADSKPYEYGTHVSDFVPISQMVDALKEETPHQVRSGPSSDCRMFDAPLSTYVRSLSADEFDCFISRLREYNKEMTTIDPRISVVVDATKNRDITLMSNLSMRLLKRKDAKAKWQSQVLFQTILPNMFDQASSDSHVSVQRNMNFRGIRDPEESCAFEICIDRSLTAPPENGRNAATPLSGDRLMKFRLLRMPNVFEYMYRYAENPLKTRGDGDLDYTGTKGLEALKRTFDDQMLDASTFTKSASSLKNLFVPFFTKPHDKPRSPKEEYMLFDRFGYYGNDIGFEMYDNLAPIIKLSRIVATLKSIYNEIQHRWSETCSDSLMFPTIVDYMMSWFHMNDIGANRSASRRQLSAFEKRFLTEFGTCYGSPSIVKKAKRKVRDQSPEQEHEDAVKMPKVPADFMYSVSVDESPTMTFELTVRTLLIKWSVLVNFLHYTTGPLDMDTFGYIYALLHPHETAICTNLTLFGKDDEAKTFDGAFGFFNQVFLRDGSGPSVANIGTTLVEYFTMCFTKKNGCELKAMVTGANHDMTISITSTTSRNTGAKGKKTEKGVKGDSTTTTMMTCDEFDSLFESGYLILQADEKRLSCPDEDACYNAVLGAMLQKTLGDLSMTTWCAFRNQNRESRDKHILLTFDRLSASIATLFKDMEHYVLFQSVDSHKKTICVHPKNGAFESATTDCFNDPGKILPYHEVIYQKGSFEWHTLNALFESAEHERGLRELCVSAVDLPSTNAAESDAAESDVAESDVAHTDAALPVEDATVVYDINDKTFFISKDDYEVSKKKAIEQQEAWLDALKSICAEELAEGVAENCAYMAGSHRSRMYNPSGLGSGRGRGRGRGRGGGIALGGSIRCTSTRGHADRSSKSPHRRVASMARRRSPEPLRSPTRLYTPLTLQRRRPVAIPTKHTAGVVHRDRQ